MRSPLSRVAATIVVALLVVACASPASPAPITTASPASSSPAPSTFQTSSPSPVSPANTPIDAGYQHTCVLTSGGGVKCWGSNEFGQLGDGTTTNSGVPIDVTGLPSGVSAIAAGGAHTCALTNGGGVKCWGANHVGQLGNGSTIESAVPVDVSGLASGVSAIAAGGSVTCALRIDGAVRFWGSNDWGQLGDGTTTDSSFPVDVSSLRSGVTAIAVGENHTCALTTGGRVKCWGYNYFGELGNGTTTDSSTPVDVSDLQSGVNAITAANNRTCALTGVGGVKCWGYGNLGNNTTDGSSIPVDVSGLASGVTAIAAGGGRTCALTSGGGVKCWGNSMYGQLGSGSPADVDVPVDVSGLGSGVAAIAAGGGHNCALMSDGAVTCWGDNWYGQLGGGTHCDSSNVPVTADFATPSSSSSPTDTPIVVLSHATGPTDVVLRYGDRAVVGAGELDGARFEPGPFFTLYGDGTVIFWWAGAQPLPADGPIHRGKPFAITHLDEDEIQALLRFALGEGGLGDACELYETRDTDVADYFAFTVRAGGLDKHVEGPGPNRFPELATYLLSIDRVARFPTRVFVPDRYWGNLFEVEDYWIESGILPEPRDAGIVPWPWPDIAPAEFVGPAAPEPGRRVMSVDAAAVLGLSDNGGVVGMVYLRAPDGTTIYWFSLWPMLPDQTS